MTRAGLDTRTTDSPASARPARASTPTLVQSLGRWRLWLILAAIAVIGLIVISISSGATNAAGQPFSITSSSPAGSKAVAEVLRAHGVNVVQADTLDEATRATQADPGATLFFFDANSYLTDTKLAEASTLADTTVLLTPGTDALTAFAPGIAPAGAPETIDGVDAGCSLPAAERAGSIVGDGGTYRDVRGDASDLCFASSSSAYFLIRTDSGGRTVTVLGTEDVLRNDGITGAGNAALALGLLGENSTLVWYMPSSSDVEADGPADIASLTPDWVTPVLILAVFTFAAAAVWRGRRLGALVVENLPVTVRSRETMEGRARLYATVGDHGHALDALRIGTTSRLTSLLALPRNASVSEVIRAASATLPDWPADDIRLLLLDAVPASESDLLALSDRLLALESEIASATRP
ncbi:DUF4350 domain-containing protein [Agreia sp. COWG]|uniref:DUF4350 domain-containing protein n=1 Tax=Agreia sp. COWG TaxID=2773266 RepID=UPI0019291585|nr:DUF4350 domain-containing protein [Agreia sp. COWG]CAD5993534.1 conserved protein of unknown function [Agreia sp. COWG]